MRASVGRSSAGRTDTTSSRPRRSGRRGSAGGRGENRQARPRTLGRRGKNRQARPRALGRRGGNRRDCRRALRGRRGKRRARPRPLGGRRENRAGCPRLVSGGGKHGKRARGRFQAAGNPGPATAAGSGRRGKRRTDPRPRATVVLHGCFPVGKVKRSMRPVGGRYRRQKPCSGSRLPQRKPLWRPHGSSGASSASDGCPHTTRQRRNATTRLYAAPAGGRRLDLVLGANRA